MKNRVLTQLRSSLFAINACFRSPALAICAALSWSLPAHADTASFTTAGTFNWVCPPGVNSIKVECWGGGGAGGGSFVSSTGTQNAGGGGGGGGAYAALNSVPVTPGNTYVITIPPAATCPASGFTNGQTFDGSDVTFTGDLSVSVTANGGKGGGSAVVTGGTAISGAAGAGGAAGTGLDAAWKGGNAVFWSAGNGGGGGGGAGDLAAGGNSAASNGSFGAGGTGSDTAHTGGNGGAARNGAGSGNAAASPGGGGGGAKSTSTSKTSRAGGAGGLGRVILTFTAPVNVKTNNTDDLNLPSSWTLGVPSGGIAEWNNIVTGANTTSLGADLTFAGIKISNPAGPVTINAGNLLTLGAAAIDLDLSTATQNLTLNCDLAMEAANVWDVASGSTVTLGGAVSGTGTITKQGSGSAILSGSSTYTGATAVTAGTLVYPSGSTFSPGGTGGVSGKLTVNGATAEATLAGTYAATGNGDAYFEIKGGGLLNFSGTANLIGGAGIRIGEASAGTMTMTGGTFTANMNSGSNLVVGRSTGGSGTLSLTGGTINVTNAGGIAIANVAGNSGVVTVGGSGQLVMNSAGTFAMGPGNATLNLNSGGTFTLGGNATASGTSANINFDGGTLRAGRSSATFLPATLSAVNVLTAGAVIDTNGFDVTIPAALLGGAGDGGLTKTGLKSLTLSGANTYTGGTQVSAGTLKFLASVPSATNVTAAAVAEAGVLVDTNDGQWVNTGNLTLQNNGAAVIDYGSTPPSTTTAPIKVTDFSTGASPGVRLIATQSALAAGQTYPLVTWTGSGPSNGLAFTCLTHRLVGTFNVSSNTLNFTVTSNASGSPISWNKGNGTWDTSTANWVDANVVSTTYFDTLDSVVFGDASGATGNPTVSLGTAVSPLSVTMDSTLHDYTVSGAGTLSGSASLTLAPTNTRTFTLATTGNSFTGGTTINGGTLALANATDTLPDTGAVVVDGASAILSLGTNSDTVGAVSLRNGASITGSGTLTAASYAVESGTISSNLDGIGNLTKTTAGTVILSGNNPRTGTTTMNAGTLRLEHTGAVQNTGLISMTGSSSVEFATDTVFTTLPLLSCSSGFTHTIVSDRATPGAGLTHVIGTSNFGNSTYNFTSGLNVTGGTAGISVAGVNISAGSTGTITLNPTTVTLSITGGVSIGSNSVAKTLGLSGEGTGHEVSGAISNGLNTVSVNKSGTSTWTLSGANTYSGTTTVSGGNLNLTGSLSNASLGNIVVQAGGTLNVSGTISGSTSTTSLTCGTTAGLSTVNVSSGASITLGSLLGGNNASAVSVYNQSGGTVTVNTTGVTESAYTASQGYGIMNLTGGNYTVHSRYTVATNGTGGGKGVTRIGGGAGPAALTAGDILAVSRGAGAVGEMTVLANGTVTYDGTGANNLLIHGNNVNGTGFLNIVGGTLSSPAKAVAFGNGTSTETSIGMINVGSGTLALGNGILLNTAATGTNRGFVNLSGGTVKVLATTASNLLLPASHVGFFSLANTMFGKVTNSTVDNAGAGGASGISGTIGTTQDFTGGVTIDTNGWDSTISGPLVAPTGGGVAQGNIIISDPGAGYVGAPLVTFSSPAAANATPAAGYALVSGGQLTGIVITSPGSYAPTDTVTVTLIGGGASTPATVADIPGASLTANTSGGLTKIGVGTLTLSGANTYDGNTVVNDGTLVLADNAQLKFVLGATSGSNNSLSGAGTATLDGDFVIDTSAADSLASGTWTLENVTSLTGEYGSTFSVVGFTDAGGDKWTKTAGSKTYTFDEITGVLTLATGGYASWASTNAAGQAANLDSDFDGVTNGVEYFMNAAAGFTANPQLNSSKTITWPNGGNIPSSAYGTQFVVQTSSNLSSWTDVPSGDPNLSNTTGSLSYTLTGSAPRFVRLVVTPN